MVWGRSVLLPEIYVHVLFCHFHYLLAFKQESTLKGQNLLLEVQIISFKISFHFGRVLAFREANRHSQKLTPFVNVFEEHRYVPHSP